MLDDCLSCEDCEDLEGIIGGENMKQVYLRDASISEGAIGSAEQILSAAVYAFNNDLGLEVTLNDYFLENVKDRYAIRDALQRLKGVTFHLHSQEDLLLDKTQALANAISFFQDGMKNIKGIIFHPENTSDINHLLRVMPRFKKVYLGMELTHPDKYSWDNFKARLGRHQEVGIVLDTSHMTEYGAEEELRELWEKYSNRVVEVHVSIPQPSCEHSPLFKDPEKAKQVLGHSMQGNLPDVPYVIEGVIDTHNGGDFYIKKEIEVIKNIG